jgi:hypothetical protein
MPMSSFNATQSTISNSIASPELMAIVFMVMVVVALAVAFYSVDYLARVIELLSKVFRSVKYVIYGALTTLLTYLIYTFTTIIMSAAKSAVDPIYLGYGIIGYVVFYIIGRVVEFAIMKAKARYSEYKSRGVLSSILLTTAEP